MSTDSHAKAVKDTTYDLISVIYHALQGAETCEQYVRDAEQQGDQELAQFLREVCTQNREIANRALRLLGNRLGQRATTKQA